MQAAPGATLQAGQQSRRSFALHKHAGSSRVAQLHGAQRTLQTRPRVVQLRAQQYDGDNHDVPRGPGAQGVYRMWKEQQPVGAEHGEGFLHFLPSGTRRVDVECLNDSLRSAGALRLRHAQHPHEAHGMVFNFDGVVADLNAVKAEAWARLAAARDLPLPGGLLGHPELYHSPPEVAIVRMLRWAGNPKEASVLALEHAALAAEVLADHSAPQAGVREWLDALGRFNVPCALVTCLDKATTQAALARMTLHDHFRVMVSAEDEADSISQRLLVASMKLGRAPNMCVYYDSSPAGITAAHNCTMKAVAVQGNYRAYQLTAADLTVGSLSELAVYNVRRLFANVGAEFMDLQKATCSADDSDDDEGRRRRNRRRLTNALLDPTP